MAAGYQYKNGNYYYMGSDGLSSAPISRTGYSLDQLRIMDPAAYRQITSGRGGAQSQFIRDRRGDMVKNPAQFLAATDAFSSSIWFE